MQVYMWQYHEDSCGTVVLFDGENTYWDDEMKPSSGYKATKTGKIKQFNKKDSKYTYLGEL